MKRVVFVVAVCVCAFTSLAFSYANRYNDDKKFPSLLPDHANAAPARRWSDSVYNRLGLDSNGLSREAFFSACKGYQYLLQKGMLKRPELLTICDMSQSSTKKRLYILDLQHGTVLFNTYVSHGRNSGSEYATSFSNLNSSHKSSLGFMVTAETYTGKAGLSMRLDGTEKGINDNVRMRDIVMHGSTYVNEHRADEGGSMGRSYGCPAVSYEEHKAIINTIKGGSCFFIYHTDNWYSRTSKILNSNFNWPSLQGGAPQQPILAGLETTAKTGS
jgi:hypothetical protein